jgi:hypothetical protein
MKENFLSPVSFAINILQAIHVSRALYLEASPDKFDLTHANSTHGSFPSCVRPIPATDEDFA